MSSKNIPQLSFEEIWERIKNKTDIKTISNLAKILEIKQPSISSQKKKGTFPVNWAYWISEKYNLSLNWILKGEEHEKHQYVNNTARENMPPLNFGEICEQKQDTHNIIFKSSENHKIIEKTRFDDAWERIKSKTDIKKISQLARIIGKTQQNISAKKIKGDEFPIEWAYLVSEKYSLSLNWILKGEETEGTEGTAKPKKKERNQYIAMLEEWLEEIASEDQRKEFWFQCTIEKALPEFKEWKDKKSYPGRNRHLDEELV